jgi:hypothetical protein
MVHVLLRSSLAVIAAMVVAGPSWAAPIDPASKSQVMQAFQRMFCGKNGQDVSFLHAWGRGYGHVEGIRDELLFDVEVYLVHRCGPLPSSIQDVGFRTTSKEIMFYRDSKTGAILKSWKNPYTGQTVEVNHAANDPVNGNYAGAVFFGGPLPSAAQVSDDLVMFSYEANPYYESPLGGDYQKYVGGMYRATEMISWFANAKDFDRIPASGFLPSHFNWTRVAQWLPWMEMGGRPGYMYFHTAGRKVATFDQLPPAIRAEIQANYPDYLTPPPLDDARPNDTSWKFFKRAIDARKTK